MNATARHFAMALAEGLGGWWVTRAIQNSITPSWLPGFLQASTHWVPAIAVTGASWFAMPARHALPVTAGAILAALRGTGRSSSGSSSKSLRSISDSIQTGWTWSPSARSTPLRSSDSIQTGWTWSPSARSTPLRSTVQTPPYYVRAPHGTPANQLLELQEELYNTLPGPMIRRPE